MTNEQLVDKFGTVIGVYNGLLGGLVGMMHAHGMDMEAFARQTAESETDHPFARQITRGAGAAMLAAIEYAKTGQDGRARLRVVTSDRPED